MRIKLDVPLRLFEIANICHGLCKTEEDTLIEYVCTDSRELREGDLFIAIKGERFDGNDYAEDALRAGAIPICSIQTDKGIKVTDTLLCLSELARLYKSKLSSLLYTVAITGSVGKSTTKEFSSVLLSECFRVAKSHGNYNNLIGVCLSILSADKDTEVLVLEFGMNSPGEISILSKIAEPDIAIITNVGTSHIGKLGSREAIAKAKLEILDGMKEKRLIIPFGEPLLSSGKAITFSTKNRQADYFLDGKYQKIDLFFDKRWLFDGNFSISEGHLLGCLAPSLALCCELGIPLSKIRSGIKKINRSYIRQKFEKTGSLTLYSDCYNSSLESVSAALEYISSLALYPRKSAVLGSVLELGAMSKEIHREIGRLAAESKCRRLYLVGEFAYEIAKGAIDLDYDEKNILIYEKEESYEKLVRDICEKSLPGELILFKGSRAMRLENVVEAIKEIKKKTEE